MRYVLLISILAFNNNSLAAQIRNPAYSILVAKKNKRIYHFFAGEKIDVKASDNGKIKDYKGILAYFTDDGICLSSFKKRDSSLQCISLHSILSVHQLLRKQRLVSGIITGVCLAATITLVSLLSNTNNNNARDNYGFVLVIFPLAGTFGGGITFLSTFITEAVTTKSVKRRWHFLLR